jgi:hypothetical protein
MKQGSPLKTKWFCPASLHNIFLYIRCAGLLTTSKKKSPAV